MTITMGFDAEAKLKCSAPKSLMLLNTAQITPLTSSRRTLDLLGEGCWGRTIWSTIFPTSTTTGNYDTVIRFSKLWHSWSFTLLQLTLLFNERWFTKITFLVHQEGFPLPFIFRRIHRWNSLLLYVIQRSRMCRKQPYIIHPGQTLEQHYNQALQCLSDATCPIVDTASVADIVIKDTLSPF